MKINTIKENITQQWENITHLVSESAQNVIPQGSQELVQSMLRKAIGVVSVIPLPFLHRQDRLKRNRLSRSWVKKCVSENLGEGLYCDEVVRQVTDSLFEAAQIDPRYRQLLIHEENLS